MKCRYHTLPANQYHSEEKGSGPSPLENHKAIGFLSNTGPDPSPDP